MPIVRVVSTKGDLAADFIERLTGQKQTPPCSWHIATKYYDVDVQLRTTLPTEAPSDETDEALILLADCRDAFAFLTEWFQSRQSNNSIPISLLVCHGAIEEAAAWSVEYGFEYIRVSLKDTVSDATLEEEGQGMKRVLEAIQAHVWPGCTLKGKSSSIRTASPIAEPSHQHDGDVEEDEFEKLLMEMSNARDHLQNLPDEERRQGAADLAMQLAQYFVDT